MDYKARLILGKLDKTIDLDWSEIVEILNLDCSPDHLRKKAYGFKAAYEYYNEKLKNGIQDQDILNEIRVAQREIYKERQKLRDEKNEYNAWLREVSRGELFLERIDESIERILNKKPRIVPSPVIDKNTDKEIVCAFADCHYGAEFKIEGFNGEVLNEYSPAVFEERMWRLRDELLSFSLLNDCNKVSIVDLGDSIEGLLHVSQLKSLRGNIVDDIMDYAEFVADWLSDLSEHRNLKIDFYTSEGNHSDLRLLTNKKGDFPHENLERIYSRFVRKILKNNPNVVVNKSLNGLNYFNVKGFNFFTAHGDNERNVKNSINEYEDTYNIEVDYMLVGHLHSKHEMEIANGKEVIQVRSLMGVNEFSNKIKKSSSAGATMFTVHEDYGVKYINEVKFKK